MALEGIYTGYFPVGGIDKHRGYFPGCGIDMHRGYFPVCILKPWVNLFVARATPIGLPSCVISVGIV